VNFKVRNLTKQKNVNNEQGVLSAEAIHDVMDDDRVGIMFIW